VKLPYSFSLPQGNGFNYLPRGGYGALIEAYAKDLVSRHGKHKQGTGRLSVFLSHQVTAIHRANTTLTVKSKRLPAGAALAFKPSAVLVAVPTSIIAGRQLKFVPPLPRDTAEAFANLPMGHFKKVALKFSCDIFNLDSYATKLKPSELQALRQTSPGAKPAMRSGPCRHARATPGNSFATCMRRTSSSALLGERWRSNWSRSRSRPSSITRWTASPR